jgi:hypothetical protein
MQNPQSCTLLRHVAHDVRFRVRQSEGLRRILSRPLISNSRFMSSKVVAERLAVVGIPFPEEHRKRVEPYFTSISHFLKPDQLDQVDREALASADVVYGTAHWIKSFDEISKARFVQLSNAGADDVLVNGFWKEDGRASRTPMATVAGIHMEPISQVCFRPTFIHTQDMMTNDYFVYPILVLHHGCSFPFPSTPRTDSDRSGMCVKS